MVERNQSTNLTISKLSLLIIKVFFLTSLVSDFRYQKQIKKLVKEAKQRILDQIDATKKGKQKGGTSDIPTWLDAIDDAEKEKPRQKLHKGVCIHLSVNLLTNSFYNTFTI